MTRLMSAGSILALFLFGCSDAALVQLSDGERGPTYDDDDAGTDDDDASDDDDGSPYNESDDDDDAVGDDDDSDGPGTDDDDIGSPPPARISECPPNALEIVDFYGPSGEDEIYVLAWNNTSATATLEAPFAGLYATQSTSNRY